MVELLIAIAIGSIVIALVVTAYWSQTQTNRTQQMTVEMQQNIRAAMFFMQRDIMMAGYSDNPAKANAGEFTIASPTMFEFTYSEPTYEEDNIDNDNDGDVDEVNEKDGIDNDGDGDVDGVDEMISLRFQLQGDELHRMQVAETTGAVLVDDIIATDIQNAEFLYTLDDGDAATTIPTAGVGGGTAEDLGNIRRVGISVLAQSQGDSFGYTDTQVFTTLSGVTWGPFNDHRRREMVTTTVVCRNMMK